MDKKETIQTSFIIPCFNYGQYLPEAIQSVLDQTHQDFEIIVVDDGSTDELTKKVVNEISHSKVRVIHQKNKGLSAARNAGIREARGEFVVPLDADDKLDRTYLEKCLWMFEHNPGIGFVYTITQTFGDYEYFFGFKEYSFRDLLSENFIPATACFRKADWIRIGGYEERLSSYEDWEFWIHLGKERVFGVLLPEPLFFYRKHADSMLETKGKPNYRIIYSQIKELHSELFSSREINENHGHLLGVSSPIIYPPRVLDSISSIFRKFQDRHIEDREVVKRTYETLCSLEGELREERNRRAELQGLFDQILHSRGWRIISFLHNVRMRIPLLRDL